MTETVMDFGNNVFKRGVVQMFLKVIPVLEKHLDDETFNKIAVDLVTAKADLFNTLDEVGCMGDFQ